MSYLKIIFIFILGLVVGGGLVRVLVRGKNPINVLTDYNRKRQEKKEKAKNKIVEFLAEKGRISHSDIAKQLKLKRTTVVRYLDELEQEGKAKQVGKVGQSVFYE